MQRMQCDKTPNKKILTLEDWTEDSISKPYRVATVVETKPNFGKRIAFGFEKLPEAQAAFDAIVLGLKKPADFKRFLTDQSLAHCL